MKRPPRRIDLPPPGWWVTAGVDAATEARILSVEPLRPGWADDVDPMMGAPAAVLDATWGTIKNFDASHQRALVVSAPDLVRGSSSDRAALIEPGGLVSYYATHGPMAYSAIGMAHRDDMSAVAAWVSPAPGGDGAASRTPTVLSLAVCCIKRKLLLRVEGVRLPPVGPWLAVPEALVCVAGELLALCNVEEVPRV